MNTIKRVVCFLLAAIMVLGMVSMLFTGCAKEEPSSETSMPEAASSVPSTNEPEEYRAIWISYLEFESVDFSTEETFRDEMGTMFDNCKNLGLNVVIVQVRPFGDALYESAYFPWSHLITGEQGVAPSYDPLQIMIEEAHVRGLKIEAWVNPYRVSLNENKPATFAQNNPAVLHEDWVIPANGGLYYNPALPEVRDYITNGVAEIVQNYDVDGIHFDDYFYPFPLEEPFDEDLLPTGESLSAWRRENVNSLIRQVYAAIKAENPSVTFGISPQGNRENNYTQQYSDVDLWMSEPGYVDYVMPQIYWGFDYETSSGKTTYQYDVLVAEWASLPRSEQVQLYIGIGVYRIGAGDGGANNQAEWMSGNNVAKMVQFARETDGVNGYALYRYYHVFMNEELNLQEREALQAVNAETEE